MSTDSPRPGLDELADSDAFTRRHIGPDTNDIASMLSVIGVDTVADLLDRTVPEPIRMAAHASRRRAHSETEVIDELRRIAGLNRARTSLIGMGYYGTTTPPVVQRNVLENPAWYTSYTPYQPEISQGRLEALLNFQTMVAELTAMDLANASLLDEATATAEAMTMAHRIHRGDVRGFLVDADVHPQVLAVVRTRAEPLDIELIVDDPFNVGDDVLATCFAVLLAHPSSTGRVRDPRDVCTRAAALGALVVVTTDLLACTLIAPPGEWGADIVVGSAQRFGVPMGFGGPHAAFMATRQEHARQLPGRLVGVSTDTHGRPALRLALQTREQHIRRERATSNICTAQALLANIAGFYASWHGRDGLSRIATRVHRLTSSLAAGCTALGLTLRHDSWFDTITVDAAGTSVRIVDELRDAGYDVRQLDDGGVGFSLDETTTVADVDRVLTVLATVVGRARGTVEELDAVAVSGIPSAMRRVSPPLEAAVFERYHSEHEMLRYLRRLSDADLAMDRTMIPLGSCTMKLNATTEMAAITWPEFAAVHPYAPEDETAGYRHLIADLEAMLCEITGYDAVSLQPNAGSQGEFAGLLAIRAFHRANGQTNRTVCLIPSSAHGTNAASAVMAGMEVVVVACDERGNVDVGDLGAKLDAVGDRLAAIMVTYPSTHGVFESGIGQICAMVHEAGGQVYVDGANLNALVGLAQPGKFGADVSHLNLHKTFCIPHGGGGPGVGPVAVKAHLSAYLPSNPLAPRPAGGVGAVSATEFGSAGILPISWAYIQLMGTEGLARATEVAIVSANYLAARLDPLFPVLYRGENGFVGHECIIDLRPLTKSTGVTVDDVAKRLIDHGFHAPTVSFPVAGTLMIEPTESESRRELDRFCDAMAAIRAEIAQVERGDVAMTDSPLRHAPHTTADLVGAWQRPYTRDVGAYPLGATPGVKYFAPVSRIDAAYGDRHLVCSCVPLEELASTTVVP